MRRTCEFELCKRKSGIVTHCCNKKMCLEHLQTHQNFLTSQLNNFANEINDLGQQLSLLNIEKNIRYRHKLDKWRDEAFMIINKYYEEKCQEGQQNYVKRVDKYEIDIHRIKKNITELAHEDKATHNDIAFLESSIHHIKHDIKQFGENGVLANIHPLTINEDLIHIEEWTSNEVDISNLSSPIRTIDSCSNENYPSMTGNNRSLLIDQRRNLCLYDKELNLVKQFPWKYGSIPDMCWSSTLNKFIILTDNDGVFLVNEDMISAQPIGTIRKEKWLSCTCSNEILYLTTNRRGSNIFEFNLLSSFQFIKQWNSPKSCNINEVIHSTVYNNGTLGLLTTNIAESFQIEVRYSTTLDRLWALPLNVKCISGRIGRICSFKWDEWLVVNNQTSDVFQISKDGKLKVKHTFESMPENAVLLGLDHLAMKTRESINIYHIK